MTHLPSGTVTFLFTDIEGSTKLAREYAETWEASRARHHQILREAIESNNGYVFQVIGDAFCAAVNRLLANTHLLTLIGPGGTGKTRLSLQVASLDEI